MDPPRSPCASRLRFHFGQSRPAPERAHQFDTKLSPATIQVSINRRVLSAPRHQSHAMSSLPDSDEVAGHVIFDDSDGSDDERAAIVADNESEPGSASSESDSDSELEANGMFDLEASEEDGDEDDEIDDDEDDDEPQFFPQFMRFPPEIRLRVWQLFCPELTAGGRVYEPQREFLLANQTASSRAVLATHRESRDFALTALPDVLTLPSGILRFHKEKDIILLSVDSEGQLPCFTGFSDQIRNLAITVSFFLSQDDLPHPYTDPFPQLKNLFFLVEEGFLSPITLRWCTSNMAKHSPITIFQERLEGWMHTVHQEMYCWPDVDKHREFAEREIPLDKLWKNLGLPEYQSASVDSDSAVQEQLKKLPVWPLVIFNEKGIRRLERIHAWSGEREDWDGSSDFTGDDEPDSESDDYDSSGIDDDEIAEATDDEDEDDLAVHDVRDTGDEDEDDDTAEFGGFSPLHGTNGVIDLTEDGEVPIAQFSSPEPESATVHGESDESDSDQPAVRRPPVKRSRKRVMDESDEDPEDEAPRKRARYVQRVEDTDDEDDEDDEDDQNEKPQRKQPAEGLNSESSEDSDEDSSEESDQESDEEDAPPRTMSLAERLQLHRQQNPVPVEEDSESGSDVDETGEDGYDTRKYSAFQDDEEDEISEGSQEELMVDLDESEDDEEY